MRPTTPIADLATYRGKYISPLQLALYIGVTRRTVYNWIDKGALKSKKIGGVVRIPIRIAREFCGENTFAQTA